MSNENQRTEPYDEIMMEYQAQKGLGQELFWHVLTIQVFDMWYMRDLGIRILYCNEIC